MRGLPWARPLYYDDDNDDTDDDDDEGDNDHDDKDEGHNDKDDDCDPRDEDGTRLRGLSCFAVGKCIL